jgi:hypothetical protein
MNKKILRDLERQSGIDVYGLGLDRDKWETKLSLFAELIVGECIDNVKVWEKDSRNHISYMLKNHFGVEE